MDVISGTVVVYVGLLRVYQACTRRGRLPSRSNVEVLSVDAPVGWGFFREISRLQTKILPPAADLFSH